MLTPEKIKAADARSIEMEKLQRRMMALLDEMKPAMLTAHGEAPDLGHLLHDVIAVLAGVAVGQVEQRMKLNGQYLNKVAYAGGASRLLEAACKKIAFHGQTPEGKAEVPSRH